MKEALVIFRYPHAGNTCTILKQDAYTLKTLPTLSDIGDTDGFVFAPFRMTEQTPILLFDKSDHLDSELDYDSIREIIKKEGTDTFLTEELEPYHGKHYDRASYEEDFNYLKGVIKDKRVDKIVLSRSLIVKHKERQDVVRLFVNACNNNPNSFVALVSSPISGTWIVATPEVLLERVDNTLHTIALAGTKDKQLAKGHMDAGNKMTSKDVAGWDAKNIDEQQYVVAYIKDKLAKHFANINVTAPTTIDAGNVLHLRSDFYVSCEETEMMDLGEIVSQLHPTPAVCGMPAAESYNIINSREHNDRRYYSGFCGMVRANADFRLFVTLRCMEIYKDCYKLYAGGGILSESKLDEEWRETELKMKTMMDCIQ